jgi:MYXO-CTERM domain-containing protein
MNLTARGVSALVACALAAPVWADDLTPPPWRFGADTTFQHWDFSAGPGGGAPDAPGTNLFNPYGTPIMTPQAGTTWLPAAGGRNDVWALNAAGIFFDIPNDFHASGHQKELWLQVTYLANAASPPPGVVIQGSPGGAFTMLGTPVFTPLPNGWIHELSIWTLPLCPQSERVAILPNTAGVQILVDQVVIDTQCSPVPGPGGLGLAALGGLVAARRRRR